MRHSVTRLLAASLAAMAALLVCAGPVAAHGDEGVVQVDVPEQRGDLTVGLRVLLTYENDDEPVAEDEVGEISVEGTGPGGETFGPVGGFEATEAPGVYAVELTFPAPGSWDLTVSVDAPSATADVTVDVDDPDTAMTVSPGEDESDDEADADDGSAVPTEGEAVIVEQGSGGDATPWVVTLLVAAALIAAIVAGVVIMRRRHRST